MNEPAPYDPRRWRRERWDEPGTLYFWSGRGGPHEAFSNFASTPFTMVAWHAELGDVDFATGEHAFQAAKSATVAEHERIRRARTPMGAKQAGRAVALPRDWSRRRPHVMLAVVRAKFATGDLREQYESRARPVTGHRSAVAGARAGLGRRLDRNTGPVGRPAISRGRSRALPDPKNNQSVLPPFERVRARDGEILDVQAQHFVGACRGLVQQPPRRALAQRDVAALPQPLEACHRDAARVVVLLGAPVEGDLAVDLQQASALAVAREGTHGRDVTVPRRRRRVMPALRDDAGQAGAGHGRVAELVLEDRERLAVLRARRRREVGL